MQTKLDARALILGVVLGACLTASLGAAGVGGPPAGRFAMATHESHAYVLDTATGEVWENFNPPSTGRDSDHFNDPKIRTPAPRKTVGGK